MWQRNDDAKDHVRQKAELEKSRGRLRKTGEASPFPLETMLARGYAVMSACYGQVSLTLRSATFRKAPPAKRPTLAFLPCGRHAIPRGTTTPRHWAHGLGTLARA
jgi:hypothetical protein